MGRKHKRRTLERAAEERGIHLLDQHDTPIDENDARIICTQLQTRAERRTGRGSNAVQLVVGAAKIASGVAMGVTCLNFEKTGSLTSHISKSIFGGHGKNMF
ncbi:MAG: hypothetical protein J6X26_00780 [Bacteroidales bacterium]|nr:hypothetical protein [Bacteroidales bacterium]